MNKAFTREPDAVNERCPKCGTPGQPVGSATLTALLRPDAREQVAESAFFCPAAACPVAYFDSFERSVGLECLVRPVYPKDPEAPICACFKFFCSEIEQDIEEGMVTRTKAIVARAQSDEARCSVMAAGGTSCVPDVQRYYMKCRGG